MITVALFFFVIFLMFAWVTRSKPYIPRQPDKYDLELEELIKWIQEWEREEIKRLDAIIKKKENKDKLKVFSREDPPENE